MIHRRGLIKLSAAAVLAPSIARPAIAQSSWPNKPVRIIIPFTPGGGADTIARFCAMKMSEVLGGQFIVESKQGAGGNIAADVTARSEPDGYTMFLAGDHHATNIFVNQSLSYHPVRDFEPVSLVVQYPVAMAIPTNSPDKTLADFIARAKADPGKLTFGSPGHGAVPHLSAELFVRAAGIQMTHVPYKGTGPAVADVISGQITMNFSSLPPAVSQIKGGNLKALAVTGDKRVSSLPDVPTLKEQGIDVVVTSWQGLFAPAKTPPDVLDKIEKATKEGMKNPKWHEALARDGLEQPPERSRAEFTRFVKDEHTFWGKKLKELKIEME